GRTMALKRPKSAPARSRVRMLPVKVMPGTIVVASRATAFATMARMSRMSLLWRRGLLGDDGIPRRRLEQDVGLTPGAHGRDRRPDFARLAQDRHAGARLHREAREFPDLVEQP